MAEPVAMNLRPLGAACEQPGPVGVYRSGRRLLGAAGAPPPAGLALVKTWVDLRTPDECDREPLGPLQAVRHCSLPMESEYWLVKGDSPPTPARYARFWVGILERNAEALLTLLRMLLMPEALPLVFGCQLGKDRTGVAAALILALLGFSESDIRRDFLETGRMLQVPTDTDELEGMTSSQWLDRVTPTTAQIQAALQLTRQQYGSLQEYAELHGFTTGERAQLRACLLER